MLDFFLYFSVTLCLADMGFLRYSILICILPLRFLAALAEILLLLNIHMYITKMSFYGFKLWTKNGTWLQNQSQIINQKPSSGGNVSGWWEPTKYKICCIVTLTLLIFCMFYVFVLFLFFFLRSFFSPEIIMLCLWASWPLWPWFTHWSTCSQSFPYCQHVWPLLNRWNLVFVTDTR